MKRVKSTFFIKLRARLGIIKGYHKTGVKSSEIKAFQIASFHYMSGYAAGAYFSDTCDFQSFTRMMSCLPKFL